MAREKGDRDPAEGTIPTSILIKENQEISEHSVVSPEISIRQKYESDVKIHLVLGQTSSADFSIRIKCQNPSGTP